MKKNAKWLLFGLIFLSIAINIFFRTDIQSDLSIKTRVSSQVYGEIRKTQMDKVDAEWHMSNDFVKDKKLDSLFDLYVKENRAKIDKKIAMRFNEEISYVRSKNNIIYFRDTDSFRWMRRVENLLNTGHFGTIHKDGKEYDDLVLASEGRTIEPIRLHYYLSACFYKVLNLFNSKLSLMDSLGLMPVFLSSVMVLAVFAASYLLGLTFLGSFVASLVIGLSPVVVHRTGAGYYDTDIYNLIFPLLIFSMIAFAVAAHISL